MSGTRRKLLLFTGISSSVLAVVIFIVSITKWRSHTLDVHLIQWEYTIQIQEYQTFHESGWSSPPEGAFNVRTEVRQHGTSKININDDDYITVPRYDTWYEYDLNKWHNSRQIVTVGADKSPYWGEYELRVLGEGLTVGSERVSAQIEAYSVSGTEGKNGELITLTVSREIWERITTDDQLNYSQRKFGKPFDIKIAE